VEWNHLPSSHGQADLQDRNLPGLKRGLPVSSVFPSSASNVAQKLNMMTTFDITNFNGSTALVYPHDDYGVAQTG